VAIHSYVIQRRSRRISALWQNTNKHKINTDSSPSALNDNRGRAHDDTMGMVQTRNDGRRINTDSSPAALNDTGGVMTRDG
jgi:hypothetical protein